MRRRSLILAGGALVTIPSIALGHTLLPGHQTVQTMGERALVRMQAANGRKDISTFVVEVFEADRWVPSRLAVASPDRLTIPAPAPGSMESTNRQISILVDLDGKPEQRIRVCTKTFSPKNVLLPQITKINTRVCGNVTVRRLKP
jgi:hypothetical protein